jgi:hypothetical protein
LSSVEIKLNGDEIVSWECDCPYDYADRHPDFYQALVSNLHPKKKANPPVDYAKEIQKCFNVRNSYNEYGYSYKKEEVEDVISCYLYLPEIRKIRLKKLISTKQYEIALSIIDEGIILVEKKNHPGTVNDWKDEKLSVYQLMENNDKVIELTYDALL